MENITNTTNFDYKEAFSRNIGLITEAEQLSLRKYTIAIPGMGGMGGAHLIAMVRLGFEKFKIADLDVYELKNFNRQYGGKIDNLGRAKVEVMREEALKINPDCQIKIFDRGINNENIEAFLQDVDFSIDALDAFVVDVRRLFFNESLKRNIPVITAGPIGFGTAFLIFLPQGPSFDEYFAIKDSMTYDEKLISFLVGLVPSMLQRPYMKKTNLKEKRGPSCIGAVNLCAGVTSINVLKILLKKGTVRAVPYYHQFDVMRDIYKVKKLHFGNRNPIQQIKMRLVKYLTKD